MWGGLTSGAAEDNNVCRNPYQKEKEANVNLFEPHIDEALRNPGLP
jgi:hypothetical protein